MDSSGCVTFISLPTVMAGYSTMKAIVPGDSQPKKILKHERKVNEKVFTLIPMKFYHVRGYVKVKVGLCSGKKWPTRGIH